MTICGIIWVGDDMSGLKFKLHNNFAALLERDHLKQVEVWKRIGSTKQQFSYWVKNIKQPHVGYVLRIHKVTGWRLDEMFEEEIMMNDVVQKGCGVGMP